MLLARTSVSRRWRDPRRRLRAFHRRVLATLLVALTPLAAAADDGAAAAVRDEGKAPVRVGYADFPPYSADVGPGRPEGYAIDLTRVLLDGAGLEAEFVRAASLPDLLNMAEAGDVDMTTLLAVTDERRLIGRFTRPIGAFRNEVFTVGAPLADVAGLTGARLGAVASSGAANSAAGVEGADVVLFGSGEEMIVALLSGKIDAAISAPEPFLAIARAIGVERSLKTMAEPLTSRPRAFLVAGGREDLADVLDHVITSDPAFFARSAMIHSRWFGQPEVFLDGSALLGALAGVAALAGLAGVIWLLLRLRARARAMTEALDVMPMIVGVFSRDGRPVLWNAALERYVPAQLRQLYRGWRFRELLVESRLEGPFLPKMTRREAEDYADDIIERLHQGEDTIRLLHTTDGRRIEARELKTGDGFVVLRQDVTEARAAVEDLSEALRRLKRGNVCIAEGLTRRRSMLNRILTAFESAVDDVAAAEALAWALPVIKAEIKSVRLAEQRLMDNRDAAADMPADAATSTQAVRGRAA